MTLDINFNLTNMNFDIQDSFNFCKLSILLDSFCYAEKNSQVLQLSIIFYKKNLE